MRKHLRLIAPIVMVLGLLLGNCGVGLTIPAKQASGATPGGTQIPNVASATYQGLDGQIYATESNTVVTTVALLGSLVVDPKDTSSSTATAVPVGQPVTLRYHINNTSNIPDAYTITADSAAPATVTGVAFATGNVPVTLNSTVSETVQPGASTDVLVTVATTGLATNTQIPVTVTARTTAPGTTNGLQSDTGTQWLVTKPAATITGPGGSTKISKTVNNIASVAAQPGGTVTFDIVAVNSGGSPATNVVMTDPIPAGITADPSSVKLNGSSTGFTATLSGNTLTVRFPSLAAGATMDISFQAAVSSAIATGLNFVNTASISADGIPDIPTSPASVETGSVNIVYYGYGGSGDPIQGATVTLLDASGNPVVLSAGRSPASIRPASAPNTQNPFVTGADGEYSFDIEPADIGTGVTYFLTLSAPTYLNRRIQLDISPGVGDPLYDVKVTSLDSQPIAMAGGFTLTTNNVSIDNIFGFFGNLPLFNPGTLTVTKSVDKQVAQAGDRLQYAIDIRNTSSSPVASTAIVDTLPAGIAYAPGTAKLDGVALEPIVSGRTLTWNISSVAPASDHLITYDAVVFPSVPAGANLTNSVTATGTVLGTTVSVSGGSSVTVQIVGSAFSQRQVITGRVFIDVMQTGRFHHGDKGVAGVRVYLEDGSSVVTDVNGRFDFPAARPGMHVVRLDTTTLPTGIHAYDGYPMTSSRATQQLVHGILDDGLIEDVQFALAPQ